MKSLEDALIYKNQIGDSLDSWMCLNMLYKLDGLNM